MILVLWFVFAMALDASRNGFISPKHVVIFGLDGLNTRQLKRMLKNNKLPHIKQLMQDGSYTFDCRSSIPTVSYTNWVSIFTGTDTSFHAVDGNAFRYDRPRIIGTDGQCRRLPNLFSVIRAHDTSAEMGAFYQWDGMAQVLKPKRDLNVSEWTVHDSVSVQLAMDYLSAHRPKVTFLYLGEVDEVGHRRGFLGWAYRKAIKEVDAQMGQVIGRLKQLRMLEETLILVVTDHGRDEGTFGFMHGTLTQAEITSFWLVSGPGIAKNKELVTPVGNMDTAAVILHALGMAAPVQWRARPVLEAIEGNHIVQGLEELKHRSSAHKNQTVVGWKYVERSITDEEQQCLIDFKLVVPSILGQVDPISAGIGLGVGILGTVLFQVLLYRLCNPRRYSSYQYASVKS